MISIACPSRGRPEAFHEMQRSAVETAIGDVQVIGYVDVDDPRATDYFAQASQVDCLLGPRRALGASWNDTADRCRGEIVGFIGDDCRFRTVGWDIDVESAFADDPYWCVWGDDGYQHGALATHPFLHRAWRRASGFWLPPFAHGWTDTWVHDVARRLDRERYLPHVSIEHLHPAAGKASVDLTYVEGLERQEGVAEKYVALDWARELHAEQLRRAIAQWPVSSR